MALGTFPPARTPWPRYGAIGGTRHELPFSSGRSTHDCAESHAKPVGGGARWPSGSPGPDLRALLPGDLCLDAGARRGPDQAVARTEHFVARLKTVDHPDPQQEEVGRLQDFLLRRLADYAAALFPEAESGAAGLKPVFDRAQAERRFLLEPARTPDDVFSSPPGAWYLELTVETLNEEFAGGGQGCARAAPPAIPEFQWRRGTLRPGGRAERHLGERAACGCFPVSTALPRDSPAPRRGHRAERGRCR